MGPVDNVVRVTGEVQTGDAKMRFKFWKKKSCAMCSIYANRMKTIRNRLDDLRTLTTGKRTLVDGEVNDLIFLLSHIHIEASRQEMLK